MITGATFSSFAFESSATEDSCQHIKSVESLNLMHVKFVETHNPSAVTRESDVENYVEFLSKEMPDIKIDDNGLLEVERKLNVYLNSDELEQMENRHAEKLIKDG
ncbi:hypothetical protein TNCV_1734711 [Trichonephila clavipes]|nr:hypothetical protein TNCV_1734711 [Trichonephila clavipes]